MNLHRRRWLAGSAALIGLPALPGCGRRGAALPEARWIGASHERGHRLRDAPAGGAPAQVHEADALVLGAGIAGLAAARALLRGGVDDLRVLELEDMPGGNSRGHRMDGIACPLGAHYLPVPGEPAVEVAQWLEEIGLRRSEAGRVVYDERHLCHSPQERLFLDGRWHDGLLPPVEALPEAQQAATRAQYRRFAQRIGELGAGGAFRLPTARAPWGAALAALDATSFDAWLDREVFDAPALRWYLDYCCRDDYGAASAQVSAWAGVHYFASRHGFHAPGEEDAEREGVLTWPEGNAWLAQRLAAPLGDRLRGGLLVTRVAEQRQQVEVDTWSAATQRRERWVAPQVVLALPLFVAARVLESPPEALREALALQRHAPWLVANLRLDGPLADRPGAAPSWDNVLYGSRTLGYVDASHQRLDPRPGPTVLTVYHALGGRTAQETLAARRSLLERPAAAWAAELLTELAPAHPDLPQRVKAIDLMRYGHAMSIPVPGLRGAPALQALAEGGRRLQYAHADLSGYSVFEEAFFHGHRAGTRAAAALRTRSSA
ncbi:FAD-dependent oxidoreductase [Piscinibacter defluvii]|uniref:FAD-dependent oxidoreductase n=1 Tax=Piscinibacter defluvii TaxID=1796922 RepID=UPI0028737BEA|nr:FAD-dependent oxidoreductase [Piscinibacter defluvii]